MGGNDARDRLYEVVAARRLQWDALLWQVPALSLTAQAFLLTIVLGPNSSRFARIVSAVLSLAAALMSMQLMASDRRAEVTDAHWLYDCWRHPCLRIFRQGSLLIERQSWMWMVANPSQHSRGDADAIRSATEAGMSPW